jgi:hypothetical protein
MKKLNTSVFFFFFITKTAKKLGRFFGLVFELVFIVVPLAKFFFCSCEINIRVQMLLFILTCD